MVNYIAAWKSFIRAYAECLYQEYTKVLAENDPFYVPVQMLYQCDAIPTYKNVRRADVFAHWEFYFEQETGSVLSKEEAISLFLKGDPFELCRTEWGDEIEEFLKIKEYGQKWNRDNFWQGQTVSWNCNPFGQSQSISWDNFPLEQAMGNPVEQKQVTGSPPTDLDTPSYLEPIPTVHEKDALQDYYMVFDPNGNDVDCVDCNCCTSI